MVPGLRAHPYPPPIPIMGWRSFCQRIVNPESPTDLSLDVYPGWTNAHNRAYFLRGLLTSTLAWMLLTSLNMTDHTAMGIAICVVIFVHHTLR